MKRSFARRSIAWLAVGSLTVGTALFFGYHGALKLRHKLQLHFAEMHAALSGEEDVPFADGNLSEEDIAKRDSVTTPLLATQGMLDWQKLSQTRLEEIKTPQGLVPKPQYAAEIQAADHQSVTMRGYIFPLEVAGEQRHFLLSAYPPSCPYCLPAAPTELVEVTLKEAEPFTYEAITVQGQFELVTDAKDLQEGRFYRIQQASIVP